MYAFFLFWPANVVPIFMLVSLLQLFIPLSVFMRQCCIGLKHYKIHIVAAGVILVGILFSYIDLTFKTRYSIASYALIFMLSSLFDVISHSIKEGLVRS
jgi:hypothetical protein